MPNTLAGPVWGPRARSAPNGAGKANLLENAWNISESAYTHTTKHKHKNKTRNGAGLEPYGLVVLQTWRKSGLQSKMYKLDWKQYTYT